MRYLRSGLFAATLCLTCSAASAQTASETVAFILFGLEDGKTVKSGDGAVRIEQIVSDSAAKYEITRHDGHSAHYITVSQVNPCQYDVRFSGDNIPNSWASDRFDFSRLVSASEGNPFTTINFSGQCPIKYGGSGKCTGIHQQPVSYPGDFVRLQKAIDYFKSSFCAGPAF